MLSSPLRFASLAAALSLTSPALAQVTVNYSDGQTDPTPRSTSAPNDPTTLLLPSGSATQSGEISGNGALLKLGAGTLRLSTPSTYTGGTFVHFGTLTLSAATASPAFEIARDHALEFNVASGTRTPGSMLFTGAGTLRKTGGGNLRWDAGAATFQLARFGLIDVQAGSFVGGSGANEVWTNNLSGLQVAAGAFFEGVEANVRVDVLRGAGTIKSGFNGAGYQAFTFGVDGRSGTFAGTLADSNGAAPGHYVKTGPGTQRLTGTSSYTGTTTVAGGTLEFGQRTAFYNADAGLWTASRLTVGAGATATFFVGGTGEFTAAEASALVALGGSASDGFQPGSVLGLDATSAPGGVFLLDSDLTAASTAPVAKLGTGTLALSGNNAFPGGFILGSHRHFTDAFDFFTETNANVGRVRLESAGALGTTGPVTFSFLASALQFSAANTTDYSARFTEAAQQFFNFDTNGQTVTFATRLRSASGTLTKNGAGTLRLTGVGSSLAQGGLNGGTLEVAEGGTLGASRFEIVSGALWWQSTGAASLGDVSVGSDGSLQNSGTFLDDSYLPPLAGRSASLTVQGGTFSVFRLGIGTNGATGVVNVHGGTLAASNLYISGGVFSSSGETPNAGTLHLTAGAITSEFSYVGFSGGAGVAHVSGGTWTVSGSFHLGSPANSSSGWLNLTGGTISAPVAYLGRTALVAGGALNVSGTLHVGRPAQDYPPYAGSSLQLSAGSVQAGTILGLVAGGLQMSGGTLTSGSMRLGGDGTAAAPSLLITGGTATATGLTYVGENGYGFVRVSGGTLHAASLRVGFETGPGTVELTGGEIQGSLRMGQNSRLEITGGLYSCGGVYMEGQSVLRVSASGSLQVSNAAMELHPSTRLEVGAPEGAPAAAPGTLVAPFLFAPSGGNGAAVILNHTGDFTFGAQMSGQPTISKYGPGTSKLTGNSTMNGRVSIYAGTLQIGGGGASGSLGNSTVTNDSILAFHRTGSYTPPTISGTGAVVQAGAGEIVLNGAHPYSGGTTIQAGHIVINQSNSLGSGAVTLDGGTLAISQGLTLTKNVTLAAGGGGIGTPGALVYLDGNLTGPGGLTKSGDNGTLVVLGAADYAGPTHVAAGSLSIAGAFPSASLTLAAGASIFFTGSQTLSGPTSGAGLLQRVGAGTTTLTGAAAHTGGTEVYGSTLRIGTGSTTGSLAGNLLLSGSAVVFQRSDATAFAGVISGPGTLTQSGTGTLTLSGANLYSGSTTVSSGTLVLANANASSSYAIAAGAVLELNVDSGSRDSSGATYAGVGTLRKTGIGSHFWGAAGATFALGAGALIEVQAGEFVGGSSANEHWSANLAGLRVLGGASFAGVEANVRVDALSGAGRITSGLNGAGYDRFTFGVAGGSGTFAGELADGAFAAKFEKAGSGTQILTGAANHTGGTVISGGTLQLGNAGQSGSLVGNVASSGALAFRRTDDVLFAGSVSGPGTLTQAGGTLTLSGASPATGTLAVLAGRIVLSGAWAGQAKVSGLARLTLAGGSLGTAGVSTVIDAGGRLDGTGTVLGHVANEGTISASGPGQTLTFSGGTVTNLAGGTLRALGGASLDFSGATELVNHGLIDRISGTITFPASFTDDGVLLDSRVVRIKSASRAGHTVSVQIDGYSAHTYRLQKSTDLSAATFVDLGLSQPGLTGQVLTFTDPAAGAGHGFYRVAVD